MLKRFLPSAILALALAHGPALATGIAPGSDHPGYAKSGGAASNAPRLSSQIRDKLTSEGFTNVKVMPRSFLVTAKDKRGAPVVMMIRPKSLAVLTMVSPRNRSAERYRSNQQ